MLNNIAIMGRLVRDVELRHTQQNTAVSAFTLAVDRDFTGKDGGSKQTDFIDCIAWRNTAEFVSKYFRKGSMAVVSGRLQSRRWEDKDGNKRTNWEVIADSVYFGDSKRIDSSAPRENEESQYQATSQVNFTEVHDDESDLPF